jgi:hypothetical protein
MILKYETALRKTMVMIDAFWRPKDEKVPERNATRRRKSRQREEKRKEIGIARYLIR